MLSVRKTTVNDLDKVDEVFNCARAFMKNTGNPNQWNGIYPNHDDVIEDIKNNNSYVIVNDNDIVGTFAFIIGEEKTYNEIYDGSWLNNDKYGTIHRIASNGKTGGVFLTALNYCLSKGVDIRIDTHSDNKVMQHLINKNGFKYCGIIYVHNHSERLAYQLCKRS